MIDSVRARLCTTRVFLAVLAAAATVPLLASHSANLLPAHDEVRALWVTRATLTSTASITGMVRAAQAGGFNTLVVQVRGRGDAYYKSSIEPRPTELVMRPEFDPLAEVLALTKPAGIAVHAWVNVNLVSSASELPGSRQHVIYRNPEWLMVPRALAVEMQGTDPRSPEYVGRIARWTRAHLDQVEGLYTSPLHSGAATHVASIAADIVRKYAVDGIHLDYARFPNEDFDYSASAVQQFKLAVRSQLSEADRQRVDAQELVDPLAYPNNFDARWRAFRQAKLNGLIMRVRTAVKSAKPGVIISAAVAPDLDTAVDSRLQDWRSWLDQDLIDVLCPMAYTQDVDLFSRQINAALEFAGERPVWAGVAAYRLSPTATLQHIDVARRSKAAGVILFSYDALVSPPNSAVSLAALARAAFGAGSH